MPTPFDLIWLGIGLVLAMVLTTFSRRLAALRERHLLANSLIVAALIYIGFVLPHANWQWFLIELGGLLIYTGFARLSLKHSAYWLVLGWLLHPAWDTALHLVGTGHVFVPRWYVMACISFDVLVAVYVFFRVKTWQTGSNDHDQEMLRP